MIRRRDREFFFEFPLYEDENCKSGDFRVTTIKPIFFLIFIIVSYMGLDCKCSLRVQTQFLPFRFFLSFVNFLNCHG